jgi:hypothetical protein
MTNHKLALFFIVLSVSTGAFAQVDQEKCSSIWKQLEDYMNDKNFGHAVIAVENFSDFGCLQDEDSEKKRKIAQVRAENAIADLETITSITSTFTPESGAHAHTTTDCLMRDYRKDIANVQEYLDSYTSYHLFKDLQEEDVAAYKSRIELVKNHVDAVLNQIGEDVKSKYTSDADARLQKALDDRLSTLSTADEIRIGNKIAHLESILINDTNLHKLVTERCIETGNALTTNKKDQKLVTPTCLKAMQKFVRQDIKAQIALLKSEKSKKQDLE